MGDRDAFNSGIFSANSFRLLMLPKPLRPPNKSCTGKTQISMATVANKPKAANTEA